MCYEMRDTCTFRQANEKHIRNQREGSSTIMNIKLIIWYWVLLVWLFILIDPMTGNIQSAVAEKYNTSNNNQTSVVGQLAYEGQGKIVGQREMGVRGADGTFKIEVSYIGTGSFKGVNVTEVWTFLNTHRPDGIIQGVGRGTITSKDHSEIATAEGYGRGHLGAGGKILYPTVQLYSTNSNGKLSFLKTFIGLSKWQVDEKSGNYTYRMWELK